MMIFKETILESAAALLGEVSLLAEGSGAAQEVEDAGEVGVAVNVAEVEADVGEPGIAVNGATAEGDVEEADSGITERAHTS